MHCSRSSDDGKKQKRQNPPPSRKSQTTSKHVVYTVVSESDKTSKTKQKSKHLKSEEAEA